VNIQNLIKLDRKKKGIKKCNIQLKSFIISSVQIVINGLGLVILTENIIKFYIALIAARNKEDLKRKKYK